MSCGTFAPSGQEPPHTAPSGPGPLGSFGGVSGASGSLQPFPGRPRSQTERPRQPWLPCGFPAVLWVNTFSPRDTRSASEGKGHARGTRHCSARARRGPQRCSPASPPRPAAGPALGASVPPRAALQGGGSCTWTTPLLEWPGTRVCRVSPARRPHPAERQRAPVTREAEQRPGPERGAARSRRGRADARQPCSFPRGWGKSPLDRTSGGRRLSSAELFYQLKKP